MSGGRGVRESISACRGDSNFFYLMGHSAGSKANLAEVLDIACKEFDQLGTVDEVELAKEWPQLWDATLHLAQTPSFI